MGRSNGWRWVIGVGLGCVLLVGAFAIGSYTYKEQTLRRVALWYHKATTEAFGKDMLRFVRHYDLDHREPPCTCPDPATGFCPCEGGANALTPYEDNIASQIKAADLAFDYRPNPAFPQLIRDALGYDTVTSRLPADGPFVEVLHRRPYRTDGSLEDLRLHFRIPPLDMRALAAFQQEAPDALVVILHGLWSNEDHVMGLDYPDLMNRLGERLFDAGLDVLAMNLTTNPEKGAFANLSLQMFGVTLHGLQARATCDAIRVLKDRRPYGRVVVYGISNGGWLVDHLSVLCDQADLYVSDDSTILKKVTIWKNERYATGIKYPLFIQYLRPLIAESSINDYLLHARAPRVHIGHRDYLDGEARPVLATVFEPTTDMSDGLAHRFVYKRHALHIPEFEILMSLLGREAIELKGFSIPEVAALP